MGDLKDKPVPPRPGPRRYPQARDHSETFIIEDEWEERKYPFEIPSSHPYSQAALGNAVGDTIEIIMNPLQTEKWKIEAVEFKYVYIFQITGADFAKNFPGNENFYSVNVASTDEREFDFSPIFKALDERQKNVNDIEDIYQKEPLSVGMSDHLFL